MRNLRLPIALVLPLAACASSSRSVSYDAALTPTVPAVPAGSDPAGLTTPASANAPEPALVPFRLEDAESPERRGKRSSGEHRQHAAISFGGIFENGNDGADTGRFGLEYEHLWPESWGVLNSKWGIGAMLEFDSPPIKSLLLAVQFVYHPVPQAGLVLAPGVALTNEEGGEDSLLLRAGMTWEFELGRRFSLAPEMFYDIEERGRRSAVIALAFGVGF